MASGSAAAALVPWRRPGVTSGGPASRCPAPPPSTRAGSPIPAGATQAGVTVCSEGGGAMRWWRVFAGMAGTGALLTGTLSMGVAAQGSSFVNWSQYLFSTTHTSNNRAATTITTANAASLKLVWKFSPGTAPSGAGGFYSSPTVYNGVIYIGARNGYFYAINESTGTVIWQRFVGYV